MAENVISASALSLFLSSSSSSDDDDEIVMYVPIMRKNWPKVEGFIENVIYKFDDKQFKKYLRLERTTANALIQRFQQSQHYPKNEQHGGRIQISAEAHVLSFLWFARNKSTLQDVAQRFNMTNSSLFRVMDRMMDFLLEIGPTSIQMPNSDEEKKFAESQFRKVSSFPGVIGCIDGTSIAIRTPSKKIKCTYTNRHDIPSITLQGICDAKRKFIDVFTGVPGKVHDSRVFKMSDISGKLPEICGTKYHILGDGAYFIRPWLLTPYKDYGALTREQDSYNKKFSATRVLIENAFGILKGRFRQLLKLDMHSVIKMTRFILACCILHNLSIDFNDFIADSEIILDEDDEPHLLRETEYFLRKRGEEKRDLIRNSFSYL